MINYFGYGSNMDLTALRAKGVVPVSSVPATLPGWRLEFSVEHFFRHEGGMGNIRETRDPADRVLGTLHRCSDADLAALDRLEAYGVGYDRVAVRLETAEGPQNALAYIGLPAYFNANCLPTRRYLNILVRGAEAAGIDPDYIAALRAHPVLEPETPPPFDPPAGPLLRYDDLGRMQTILGGHVYDMSRARAAHSIPQGWFAGLDVTVFHLKRNDASDGTETLEDVIRNRLSPDQQRYLNLYLHAFDAEYDHVGRFDYASLPEGKQLT